MPAEAHNGVLRHPSLLWLGWGLGPVAWSLHLVMSYVLVPWVCETGNSWVLHAATLASLLPAAAGGLIAWRSWDAASRGPQASADVSASRARFMAAVGITISALSALLIVAEGLPSFFLSACL